MRKITIGEVQPGMDVIYEKTIRPTAWVTSFILPESGLPMGPPLKHEVLKGKVICAIRKYSNMFPDDVLVCVDDCYEKYKDMDFFDILQENSDTYALRSIGRITFVEPNKTNLHFKEKLKDWGDNE